MTTATIEKLVSLSPDELEPHPNNPRPDITRENTAELRALIELHEQTTPALVRPLGSEELGTKGLRHQIILGHRRAFVCGQLGRKVLCRVQDLDDKSALAVMLADNLSHQAPDPLRESEAIAALVEIPGWSISAAADYLAKPLRWVAARANLRTLSPAWRAAIADKAKNVSKWPVDWLAEVAALVPEAQDTFLERVGYVRDRKELEAYLAEYFHVLRAAPWKLDDAELVPAAGACSTCPKTSASTPGLFDEGEEQDLKKATCRDSVCWRVKTDAHVLRQVAAVKAEEPKLVLIDGERGGSRARPDELQKRDDVLASWETERCKKTDKGAVAAVVVSGKGAGQKTWVKPKKERNGYESPAAKKLKKAKGKKVEDPAERLEASRQKIEARRKAFFVDQVREAIPDQDELEGVGEGFRELEEAQGEKRVVDKAAVPSFSTVLGLAAAFEVEHAVALPAEKPKAKGKKKPADDLDEEGEDEDGELDWEGSRLHGAKPKARAAIYARCIPDADVVHEDNLVAILWPRIVGPLREALKRYNPLRLPQEHELAVWLAGLLEIDAIAIETAALEAIPNPKWWGKACDKVATAAEQKLAKAVDEDFCGALHGGKKPKKTRARK